MDHAAAGAARGDALRVLVVDENADAAKMLGALECARRERPDVLLLDIGLPDMDGYELARRLRAQTETAQAMLVALIGYGQQQDRNDARAAGFDHYLVKPTPTPSKRCLPRPRRGPEYLGAGAAYFR